MVDDNYEPNLIGVRVMNFKKICMTGAACLAIGILPMPSVASASSNNSDNSDEQSEFIKAYDTGKEKGILTDQNMTQSEFLSLCKESVFPAYLEYQQTHPTVSFAQYVEEDNYEVPRQQAGDNPITVSATGTKSNSSIFPFTSFASVSARKGYSMKAGDILICYGRNITSKYIGHAAIASSSKYIMEMPGPASMQHIRQKQLSLRETPGTESMLRFIELGSIHTTLMTQVRTHISICI